MIPSGWKKINLGEIVKIVSGESPSKFQLEDTGKKPYVKVEDLNNCNKYQSLSRFYTNDKKRGLVPPHSVLFPKRGAAIMNNKVRINASDLYMDTNLMALIPNESSIIGEFLYYKITFEQLHKIADTSTIPQINNKHIEPLEIYLPPINEQEKIAKILSTWDEAIEKLEKIISNLETIKVSQLSSLILKCKKSLKNTTLGEIAELINGRAYKQSEWEEEGTPVIRLQNLTGTGDKFYYSTLDLQADKYCYKDDILFMWSATFGPHIWQGAKAIFHYHIWKVVPKNAMIGKSYLYFLLLAYTELWRRNTNGSTMAHLTKESMEKVSVLLPDIDYQDKISNYFISLDTAIFTQQQILKQIKLQKQGLMQQLLTGRRRVKV